MTDIERLRLDIETLRESIQLGHAELAGLAPSGSTKSEIIGHLQWCGETLLDLVKHLEKEDPKSSSSGS